MFPTAAPGELKGRTGLVIWRRLWGAVEFGNQRWREVEQGDHATLLAKGGLYARLARLQFETGRRRWGQRPKCSANPTVNIVLARVPNVEDGPLEFQTFRHGYRHRLHSYLMRQNVQIFYRHRLLNL